jgi:paraquat-inducible protein B
MKRNALLIGGFLIGTGLLVIASILWLSGNNLFQQQQKAVMYFQGSVSGLYIGAPVTFRGVAVGQVDEIGIEVDRASLQARIPVRVRLRPDVVQFRGAADPAPLELQTLVQRGLRARLVAQSFVTGQKSIDLDFVPDTPATIVGTSGEAEIPALADRFGALIEQVAELPLRETVEELRSTVGELRGTLQSVQRTLDGAQSTLAGATQEMSKTGTEARRTLATASAAIRELQGSAAATLGAVTQLSETTRNSVAAAQPELQRTLIGAREAAESARLAMSRVAELTAPGAALRGDLDAAVRDLSQAARGLREWSEVLEEKPNAVIFGTNRQ